uniref:Movement protein BC1 n=1 Tax=Rhynchosia yellow mosaic India virus TaxID=935473 RepID=E7D6V4_9GEMI|nr:movement protein [Rhynchosia yellow mosaic India virus]
MIIMDGISYAGFVPHRNCYLITMENYTGVVATSNYIESKRCEYKLTNDDTEIALQFPTFLEQKMVKLMGKCMKIDHVVIEYRNQVPFNATGTVVVTILDKRLCDDEAAQAAFTFPIGCNVDLHYFSSSFFSVKDTSPWQLVYKVEDSNVIQDTMFAQIMARLKLSTAKHSTDIRFKPPRVKILSKDFTPECVDFWSVGRPKPIRRLLNPNPIGRHDGPINRPILLQPGETWATKSQISRSASMRYSPNCNLGIELKPSSSEAEFPLKHLHQLPEASLDPGDSVSQTNNSSISRKEIEEIIESTVNKYLVSQKSNVNKKL